jgi:hypothetical protein
MCELTVAVFASREEKIDSLSPKTYSEKCGYCLEDQLVATREIKKRFFFK